MTKIVAFSNHKGGVAKTTSAVNIGAGLANLGKKVLLIDIDPQANLTQSLGIKQPKYTIYEGINGTIDELPIIEVTTSLYLVPSCLDLSGAEIELSSEAGREFLLKEVLAPIVEQFDYILIDCPPSLGLLTINALVAANQVFIPLQAEFLATQGVAKLVEVIEKIKKRLNKKLEIGGVLITQYDNRKILNRDVAQSVKEFFQAQVFDTKIRENVALAEAPSQGLDIFRYNPKSNGAVDYLALCQELLKLHSNT